MDRMFLEPLPRCDVLGVGISAVNMAQVVERVGRWITGGHRTYACVTGVHGVMESQKDPQLKRIHNAAGLVMPDGMPMVWLSRLKGFRHVGRVCGREIMLAVCQASVPQGYRHYFYGGAEGVAQTLAGKLQSRFPGLQVAGTFCPPFRPLSTEEDQQVVARINQAEPDILWIGLSTPKQERWMSEHLGRIRVPVMIGAGAAFDFNAGRLPVPPPWMQRCGLEWCFRLLQEPGRLWKRYLTANPLFVACLMLDWLRLVDFRLPGGMEPSLACGLDTMEQSAPDSDPGTGLELPESRL